MLVVDGAGFTHLAFATSRTCDNLTWCDDVELTYATDRGGSCQPGEKQRALAKPAIFV